MSAGCGGSDGTYPVSGVLHLKGGEAFNTGTITFHSSDGKTYANGVKPDGAFQLKAGPQADGLEPGEYKVLVHEISFDDIDAAVKPTIHPKYRTEKTTDLQVTVKEEDNVYDLTLDPVPSRR